jgi:sec-independent protein translocase protein TatB
MFDVGFSEMIVIAVVALIVIGPEKLPKVARTVGALLGRMQRYVNDVKADINREIELDELKKMHTSVKEAAESFQSTVKETVAGFESHATDLNAAVAGETKVPDGTVPAPEALPVPDSLAQAIEAAQADADKWPAPDEPAPAPQTVYAAVPAPVPMPEAIDAIDTAQLTLDLPPAVPQLQPEPAKSAS